MQEDAELVRLSIGGDKAAFAELYERYFDNVYDFLVRMVKDREEAADLAQDTFMRAMNSLPSLAKGGSFKSWLFTIARNTALNRLDRSSRTQPMQTQSDEGETMEMQVIDEDRFSNPEEAMQAKTYASLVWEAANSLDPRTYSVLDLSVRQNLSNEEMAEVLGVKRNNAYVMVNRMKQAMEGAIGSLVLLRNGRHECAELDAVLSKQQIAELTPEVRKVIEKHAGGCKTCGQTRQKLASPFAVFAGIGLVAPAAALKAGILENLSEDFDEMYDASSVASTLTDDVEVEEGSFELPGIDADDDDLDDDEMSTLGELHDL
jgi:RNA polymerase sigma factor (sigma-70 family)